MIHIHRTGLEVLPGALPRLKTEFDETGCAMLPGFLSPPILELLKKQLAASTFVSTDETSPRGRVFGNTMRMPQTERAAMALNFLLNREDLFAIARQIGSTPPLMSFLGRVHQTAADAEQHIEWHNDDADFRIMAIDINLSDAPYTGGLFQIRDPHKQIRREVHEWKAGDAFFFKIEANWEHRLTRVEAGNRTVGVGWFRTHPMWESLVSYEPLEVNS